MFIPSFKLPKISFQLSEWSEKDFKKYKVKKRKNKDKYKETIEEKLERLKK